MGGDTPADDPYLTEILTELATRGLADPERELTPYTGVTLRPETIATRQCETALALLRHEGFEPLACEAFVFNRNMAREEWRWSGLRPAPVFCALVDLYCRTGESLYLLLRDERAAAGTRSATERLRTLKGSALPDKREPTHLRARLDALGLPVLNFLHGPDDTCAFLRELGLFLSTTARQPVVEALATSTPQGPRAEEAVEALYARTSAFDLRPVEAARRVREALVRQPVPGVPADWAELLVRHERTDWRAFVEALDDVDGTSPVAVWDRMVVAAAAYAAGGGA